MSRKQRIILTFSARIPLPPGWTQAKMLAELKLLIDNHAGLFSPESIVKIEKREVTYL